MSKKASRRERSLKPAPSEMLDAVVQSYEPELVLASPRLVQTVVNELDQRRAALNGLSTVNSAVDFYPRCRTS